MARERIALAQRLRSDLLHMVGNQTLVLLRTIVQRVLVVRGRTRRELVTKLPEEITRQALRLQCSLLPRLLDLALVRGRAVLFEQARLVRGLAGGAVDLDPQVAPLVGGAPYIKTVH